MKVVIEARFPHPEESGGVTQAVISLATALSSLRDCRPDEEFIFITLASAGDWLDKHISGPCRLHKIPLTWKNRLARSPLGGPARMILRAIRKLRPPPPQGVATSDGLPDLLGADLVHFPAQQAYLTHLPNIYQPHDLQHLHLPQFFPAADLAWRTIAYPLYCAKADIVLVESSWTKDDVSQQYGIDRDKIAVCPFPPATTSYREPAAQELAALKQKLGYSQFIFYPAHPWPHKNHLRLIEALALLKEKTGLVVPLICTGRGKPLFSEIESTIQRLGLSDQVRFLGYLSEAEMKAVYRLCTAVVIPTKFESVSFLIWEAFEAAKPVACSTVTSLPMQLGEAGLLFDPEDPNAIAEAIKALWENAELREQLGQMGAARLRQFSLDRMAAHILALYRRLARTTNAQDRAILEAPPLI